MLFCSGSCENKEFQRFVIQNNSDMEIVVFWGTWRSMEVPRCFIDRETMTRPEVRDIIQQNRIAPHSSRDFGRRFGTILNNLQIGYLDTLYVGAFYRIDMDTMSCAEFEQKYPLKKEWRVTSADMDEFGWTLVYP